MTAGVERLQPGPGQESVWDYPRPPALEASSEHVQVVLGGVVIAETRAALRLLETSHPPTYYLPVAGFRAGSLRPVQGSSVCEWKGVASYVDLLGGAAVAPRAGWFYPTPTAAYAALRDHIALYPGAGGQRPAEKGVVGLGHRPGGGPVQGRAGHALLVSARARRRCRRGSRCRR
jgi:uncharacterized protein (DUF427 family)